jgi:hypothetical protein
MEFLNKNKTIIVSSSPENSYYKELKRTLENQPDLFKELEKRNLEIVQDTTLKSGDFNFSLYGQDGSLFKTDKKFDNSTFPELFNFVDKITPKQSQSGGSRQVNYREKYYKYKHKYEELNNVISSFAPNHSF